MNRKTLIVAFLLLLLHFSLLATEDEYFRKAALLQKISEYIKWPEEMGMNDSSKPFVIGVIGKNPFGSTLENCYQEKKSKIKKSRSNIFQYRKKS
jgi:hypothetical protein